MNLTTDRSDLKNAAGNIGSNQSARLLLKALHNNPDFIMLFFKREGRELLGLRYASFWFLVLILFITFTAIGFSNGSLKYLEEKMSDPFTRWVNLELPWEKRDRVADLNLTLNNKKIMNEFGFESLNGYYKFDLQFFDEKRNGYFRSMGRTIEYNSPLLNSILDKKNLVVGRSFHDDKELGIIVTKEFLNTFNYPLDVTHVYMYFPTGNNTSNEKIPLPVIAVVKELPDVCQFASTPYFYNQRALDSRGNNPFNPLHTKDLVYFTHADSSEANHVKSDIQNVLQKSNLCGKNDPMVTLQSSGVSYIPGYEIRISFFPRFDSIDSLNQVHRFLVQLGLVKNGMFRNYDFNTAQEETYRDFDYLSVNFKTLDKIREFKKKLYDDFGIQIDMAQIESKENFNFISKLTRFISLILIGFSILSISLFLSNLLRNHLVKIRTNIGTFKAFGLDNSTLKKIYLSIVSLFILVAMLLALLLAYVFGHFGGIRAVLFTLAIELEKGQSYFNLYNIWTLISIVAIILVSLVAISFANNRIFNQTPGNLINKRD